MSGKFEALYGVDVRGGAVGRVARALPAPIIFLNDADAFLWGEWLFGAAAGHDRCVAITLGTGIGSAFIADGELRHDGPGVPPEGRVDLLRIAGLALEDVVSARAIEKAYRERTGVVPESTAYIACPGPRRGRSGGRGTAFIVRATRAGAAPVAGGVRRQRARHRRFDDRLVGPDRAGSASRPRRVAGPQHLRALPPQWPPARSTPRCSAPPLTRSGPNCGRASR